MAAGTLTRRSLLAAGVVTVSAALLGCSNSSAPDSGDEGSGEFDFTEATPPGQVIPAAARRPAPSFTSEYLDGAAFDSASLAGDIVVINFWGSWCAPCRIEIPEFQLVYTDVADAGVQFLGVDVKDQRQLAQSFVDDVGATYPSLFDPRGEVALAFRGFPTNVVPTTILLDRSGRVAGTYIAAISQEELRAALDQLLAEDG